MSITLSLVLDKTFCCEQVHQVNNLLVEYGKRVNTYVDYQLTIQTRPGGALFEGTLRFDEETKNVQMMGDISRINRYGTQSHCIDTTNETMNN
jgi:hypothetical protein